MRNVDMMKKRNFQTKRYFRNYIYCNANSKKASKCFQNEYSSLGNLLRSI